MKNLYTKKQIIDMLNEHAEFNDYYPNVSSILENYTPIQLPSDEEIKEEAKKEILYALEAKGFHDGAKWMRDKIKGGQDNETHN